MTPKRHTWSELEPSPKGLTHWHTTPPPHALPLSLPIPPSLSSFSLVPTPGQEGAHQGSEGWAARRCRCLSVAGGVAASGCAGAEEAAWGGTPLGGPSSPCSCSPGGPRAGPAGPGWWRRGSHCSGKPHWPPAPLRRWALRTGEDIRPGGGSGLRTPAQPLPGPRLDLYCRRGPGLRCCCSYSCSFGPGGCRLRRRRRRRRQRSQAPVPSPGSRLLGLGQNPSCRQHSEEAGRWAARGPPRQALAASSYLRPAALEGAPGRASSRRAAWHGYRAHGLRLAARGPGGWRRADPRAPDGRGRAGQRHARVERPRARVSPTPAGHPSPLPRH